MTSDHADYLSNQFLLAMPHMQDPVFAHTLIYMVEHSPEGAMGLIVNQPLHLSLAEILGQLQPDKEPPKASSDIPIFSGGPVHSERGFVLYPMEEHHHFSTTHCLGEVNLSTSRDALNAIANRQGPEHYLIALGYAGWEAGQLEQEIAANQWLTCPTHTDILFHTPVKQRTAAAAATLGINLQQLSSQVGHA